MSRISLDQVQPWVAGGRASASGFNTVMAEVRRLANAPHGGGVWWSERRVIRLLADRAAHPGEYEWEQVGYDAASGSWVKGHDMLSTAATDPYAMEAEGLDVVGAGQIVEAVRFMPADANVSYYLFVVPRRWVWMRLTGGTDLGGYRWRYQGSVVVPTGRGVWGAPTPALPAQDWIFNSIEAPNVAGATVAGWSKGHGVNIKPKSAGGNYPNGYAPQPISRYGAIVQAYRMRNVAPGVPPAADQYWWAFSAPNADDGTCT